MDESLTLLAWNMKNGGQGREQEVKKFIHTQRRLGATAMALTDTHGWRERYGDDAAIAEHVGFKRAILQPLDDDRLKDNNASITFATDHPVAMHEPLDLGNRQGLKVMLDIGGKALQVLHVYLDDLDETTRQTQIRALFGSQVEDERTVLAGDLNTLRDNLRGASFKTRISNLGFRAIASTLSLLPGKQSQPDVLDSIRKGTFTTRDYYQHALPQMNRREIIPELIHRGWQDADPQAQPTFRVPIIGGIGLDYIFSKSPDGRPLTVDKFAVIRDTPSDHHAIRARIEL